MTWDVDFTGEEIEKALAEGDPLSPEALVKRVIAEYEELSEDPEFGGGPEDVFIPALRQWCIQIAEEVRKVEEEMWQSVISQLTKPCVCGMM